MKFQSLLSIITIVVVVLLFSNDSYAQKEINSIHGDATVYANADYVIHPFSKLLVVTGLHKKDENERIVKQFNKIGIVAVTSMELLPPVKEYSNDDIKSIAIKNNVDGIIYINIKGKQKNNYRLAVTKHDLEVNLYDVKKEMTAVNFVGSSASMTTDKAINDFFKAIMPELKPILGK